MNLNHSRKELTQVFHAALKPTNFTNKLLIQANTGVGKTECLQQINQYTTQFPLLCFPSHSLKNEFSASFKLPHRTTPNPPKELIEELQSASLNVSQLKGRHATYYKELLDAIHYPGIVLTTHDAFLIAPDRFPQQQIIFDEVPQSLFGKLQTTSLLGIHETEYLIQSCQCFSKKIPFDGIETLKQEFQFLKQVIERNRPTQDSDWIFKTIYNPLSVPSRRLIITLFNLDSYQREYPKIAQLLQADILIINYLLLKLSTFQHFPFSHRKKYICFSATPNKELFKHFNFSVTCIQPPPLLAKVIQIDINTSKQALRQSKTQDLINKCIRKYKIEQVITFKAHIDTFIKANSQVYFGNTQGTNQFLQHHSLGIIGTPLNNVQYFYDLALCCKKNFTFADIQLTKKKVDFPQKSVILQTFKHDWLTERHIEQIGDEYTQAMGRIRPYNRECTIYIFSHLPLFSTERIGTDGFNH